MIKDKKTIKKKKAVTIGLVAISCVVTFYFFGVPYLLKPEMIKTQIEKAFKQQTGGRITLDNTSIDMGWDLTAAYSAKKIEIYTSKSNKLVSFKDASLRIFLPTLLWKKVSITYIGAKQAILNLERSKNGSFNFQDIIPVQKGKKVQLVDFNHTKISLSDYNINFKDNVTSEYYKVHGDNLSIKDYTAGKNLSVEIRGVLLVPAHKHKTNFATNVEIKLPLNKKNIFENRISVKGNIKNFYIKDFSYYLKNILGENYTDFGGSMSGVFKFNFPYHRYKPENFNLNLDFDDLFVMKNKNYRVIYMPKGSNIKLAGTINKKTLQIKKAFFKLPKVNASINGVIDNYSIKEKRNINLKLFVKDSSAKAVALVFPKEIKIKGSPFHKILKYNMDANISGNLHLKGYYRTPLMNGQFRFNNLTTKFTEPNAPETKGVVGFKDENILIDTKLYLNKNTYCKVKGRVNAFFAKDMDLSIIAKASRLDEIEHTIVALSDILVFQLGPLPLMELKGSGESNMRIYGTFKTVNIDGYVNVHNGFVKYKYLSLPAENVNGRLLFKKNKIYYNEITGFVKGMAVKPRGYSILEANGSSSVDIKVDNFDMSIAHKLINSSYLLRDIKKALATIDKIEGRGNLFITLNGNEANLKTKGYVDILTGSLFYKGISEKIKNIKGRVNFTEKGAQFVNVSGDAIESKVLMNGAVDKNNNVDITFDSDKINIEKAVTLIKTSPLLVKTAEGLISINKLSGFVKVKMHLFGKVINNNPDTLKSRVEIELINGSILTKDFGSPVDFSEGSVVITDSGLIIKNGKIKVLGLPGSLNGSIKGSGSESIPNLVVDLGETNIEDLKKIADSKELPKELITLKPLADMLVSPKGKATIKVRILGKVAQSDINLKDFTAKVLPLNVELKIKEAKFVSSPVLTQIEYAKAVIADSNFSVTGNIGAGFSPDFNLKINGELDSKDIKTFINPYIPYPIVAKGKMPVVAHIKKTGEYWYLNSNIPMDEQNQAYILANIYSENSTNKFITITAKGKLKHINLENFQIKREDGLDLLVANGELSLLNNNQLIQFKDLNVTTSDKTIIGINFKDKNNLDSYFAKGYLNGDLRLNGTSLVPSILGNLYIKDFEIPSKKTLVDFIDLVFNDKEINLKNSSINIADSNVKVTGAVAISSDSPITFKKLDIISPSLNLDQIAKIYMQPPQEENNKITEEADSQNDKIDNDKIEVSELSSDQIPQKNEIVSESINQACITPDTNAQPKNDLVTEKDIKPESILSESKELKSEDLTDGGKTKVTNNLILSNIPIIIENGNINAKELIIRDLIINNVAARFILNPDKTLNVSDITYDVAGGYGNGEVYIDLNDNTTSVYLSVKQAQANAAATTLLNLPNEVYGTLNGSVRFTTKGLTPEELMSNVDGVATFDVVNGRLVRLGSLEYLLRAGNILQSGVIGFNVNNIIDLVVPQKTGYFDTLTGSIYAKNGIIKTDDITSKGNTLSLLIKGEYVLATNNADITILGKMPKQITGILGPLGSLSVNTFIGFIPGIGFVPGNTTQEDSFRENASSLAKIPGLGLDIGGGKQRYFKAIIKGEIKGTTKSFEWLN